MLRYYARWRRWSYFSLQLVVRSWIHSLPQLREQKKAATMAASEREWQIGIQTIVWLWEWNSQKSQKPNVNSEWMKAGRTFWVGISNIGPTAMTQCLICDSEIWSDMNRKLLGLFSVLNLASVYSTVRLYLSRGFHLFQWALPTGGLTNL